MRGINKAILLGTLGRDPESRTTSGGTVVANFSIAVNESFKNKTTGQWEKRTEWLNIVAFGRTAETASEYLRKGSKVYIEGRIKTEKWKDKQGNDRYTTKIYADEIQFLDNKGSQGGGQYAQEDQDYQPEHQVQTPPAAGGQTDEFDDDIPF